MEQFSSGAKHLTTWFHSTLASFKDNPRISKPLSEWTNQDVIEWLTRIGATEDIITKFRIANVNGNALASFQSEDLMDQFGLEHSDLDNLLAAIEKLKVSDNLLADSSSQSQQSTTSTAATTTTTKPKSAVEVAVEHKAWEEQVQREAKMKKEAMAQREKMAESKRQQEIANEERICKEIQEERTAKGEIIGKTAGNTTAAAVATNRLSNISMDASTPSPSTTTPQGTTAQQIAWNLRSKDIAFSREKEQDMDDIERWLKEAAGPEGESCSLVDQKFSLLLDEHSPINMRSSFSIPLVNPEDPSSGECIYLCGNSLGLLSHRSRAYVNEELSVWACSGVRGHFASKRPWAKIDCFLHGLMADIVGAQPQEVAVMNGLTVNLHLMMVQFYKPTATRYKILMEAKPFPSDLYAVQSHIRTRGFDPMKSIIFAAPRPDEDCIRTEDILALLSMEGSSIAMVLLGGIQYYTGQFFDIAAITSFAKQFGCTVGWDLAHAVGNVPLQLHQWNVDFACWCSYKYLNSG